MYNFLSTEHFNRLWRLVFAQVVIVLLFMMNVMTFSVPMMEMVRPTLFLMGMFYWAIYRPSLLSVIWIFILGIVYDSILGFPIGLHSILFVLIQYIVSSQRLFFMGQAFVTIWCGFALAAFILLVCEWGIFSAILMEWMPVKESLFTWGISIFIFPFVSLLLFYIHKILPVTQDHHYIGGAS